MAGPLLSFDADQQISAIQKNSPQHDRWHVEEIAPRNGPAFHLVVIADGDGSEAAGAIAELAVQIAFAEARLRRDEPLSKLFKHLLTQMNLVVSRQEGAAVVGITMAAIRGSLLSIVQAGSQTRCYRVRGERAALLLSKDNDHPLGKTASLPALPFIPHKLRKGDKLVFCTDGLFAGGLVNTADMAKIDRYTDIKGAARHLSALAMGRNVNDNVTVIVAAYGRKWGLSLKNVVFDVLGILLAVLIISGLALVILRASRVLPRPPDLGIAVLAEGSAVQVEPLQIIYPGRDVTAAPNSPIQIRLKRRVTPKSAVTQTIPNVSLFFGAGTHTNLAAIDVQGFTDPRRGIQEPTNLTEVLLYEGRLLILNRDQRTFYIWLGSEVDIQRPLIVLQGSEAALGVELLGEAVNAYCLRGSCSLQIGGERYSFGPSGKLSFTSSSAVVEGIATQPIEQVERGGWLALCSTWLPNPEDLLGACELLVP